MSYPYRKDAVKITKWYHNYFQYLGNNQFEETIVAVIGLREMRPHIRKHVKPCVQCQLGIEIAQVIPWNQVCVDSKVTNKKTELI